MDVRETLLCLSIKYKGDWQKIYNAISDKKIVSEAEVEETVKNFKGKYVTIIDDNYPQDLKNSFKPPFVLFYEGDFSILSNGSIRLASVGTREPSGEYAKKTYEAIFNINKDIVIVSGLAKGIDGISHIAALDSGKKTIAIIGSGLDNFYPIENSDLFEKIKKLGLVMSEYPPSTPPSKENFPCRNRIVAALSQAVFIAEGTRRSGSSITAGIALSLGRDVMCFPGRNFGNSICNQLIKDGAYLVENAEDIDNYLLKNPY